MHKEKKRSFKRKIRLLRTDYSYRSYTGNINKEKLLIRAIK